MDSVRRYLPKCSAKLGSCKYAETAPIHPNNQKAGRRICLQLQSILLCQALLKLMQNLKSVDATFCLRPVRGKGLAFFGMNLFIGGKRSGRNCLGNQSKNRACRFRRDQLPVLWRASHFYSLSLFNGIYNEIDGLKSSVRTNGNAEGLIFIVLLGALFLSMFLYDKFSNHTALFWGTLWAIAAIMVVFLFRWQGSLRFKAAHKYLNIHLQRYMEYKHIRIQDLNSLSSGLKGEFKVVRKYLSWAAKRIDPDKYYTNIGYS
jgi:hypothetical protein